MPTFHSVHAVMPNASWMLTFFLLLLAAKLPSPSTAQDKSFILGRTVPSNDTALEVNAGRRETFVCQFILQSEHFDTALKIRWFFNSMEIVYNDSLPGVFFSVSTSEESLESNLTLDIDDPAILHDGVIKCYPPSNETTGDAFAVFRTFLAPRTVTIRWNTPSISLNEDEGGVMLCATAQGWTTTESTLTLLLSYNGTATVNEDFRGGPETLTFTEPTVCIDIEIVNDSFHELNEHILLDMEPTQNLTRVAGEVNIVTSTAAEVVIIDDEETRVGINVPDPVLPETSNQTEVCVRVLSDEECPITFLFNATLHIIDNTTAGSVNETILLMFLKCSKEQCVQIVIENDDRAENEERITVRLEIPGSPRNGIIARERERVITILDDDVFPEHSTYTVPENGRSVQVCFIGRGAPLPWPVTLTLSTHNNGSATAGEDYVALSSAPISLVRESGRGCIEVSILPDDSLEDTENFSISLDSSASTPTPSVTISITDTTVCMTGELRLADGATNNTGRLEVCYSGEWGTVCDDLFNSLAASVACRQLGFDGQAFAMDTGFQNGDLPTLMDDIRCTGSESRLVHCRHKTREGSNCDNTENIGLICGDSCVDGAVKLTSLDINGDFYVEICHDGMYLQVCGDDWDTFDATVACRFAGFDKYSIAIPDTGYKTYNSRAITNTTCAGTERDFSSCGYNVSYTECPFAAVRCNSHSPCPRGTFWCPESSSAQPICIPRDGVCNGSRECSDTNADERDCIVVNFTQESYRVGEASDSLNVCVQVSFPESPLLSGDPTVTLSLRTLHNSDQDPFTVALSFNLATSTQCTDIKIVDDNVVAPTKQGFTLSLDSEEEDKGLHVDRRLSHLAAFVEIIDNEVCNASSQFICKSRLECLPLSVICDGVLDCNDTHSDESNCTGFCRQETIYGMTWPLTLSGECVVLECPGNHSSNKTAVRECRDSKWVDTGTCFTFGETLALTERNIVEFLRQLMLVVAGASEEEETYDNAQVIARGLASAAALLREPKLSLEEMVEVLGNIIEILDRLLRWDSETAGALGSQNVENFEAILVSLITSPNFKEQLSITREDISFLARPVKEMQVDSSLPFTISSINRIADTTDGSRRRNDQIATSTFPSSIFISEQVTTDPLAVALVAYEVPVFFPVAQNNMKRRGLESSVGTPVVSMIVGQGGHQLEFDRLDPPVEVTLEVTQAPIENVTNPRCVFWDFTHDEWSTEGCKTRFNASRGQITCTCTHLTNFAALVDVCRRTEGCETSDEADYALSIVSFVGVCLSLMGLTVTIFTMLYFRTLRKRDASKFHTQLCLAMLFMLLVFVAGVRQTEEKAGCVTVSVLIHYFTLATVMWMGAEAVLMFQKLVIVFGKVTTRHIVIISLICWLAPILPVIIPVAINPDYVIYESEDNSAEFCFISNTEAFFAAFLAPIMAIILFNCGVFVIIVTVLIRHKQRNKVKGLRTSKTKERQSSIRLMISIAGIMSLYGLTWIFGALTIDKASLTFQVLFVLFNSLQGFFIFLFFCVLSRDGRELWLEFLSFGHYKSSHLHPSSIITSSAEKRPNHFTSDNFSATPAPGIEKSITSEGGGGTYVVNYVELSDKSKHARELTVTTDIDGDRLTPEPSTIMLKSEVDNSENHSNGTSGPRCTESGMVPLQQVNGDLHHPTSRETISEREDSRARERKDPTTSETPSDQNDDSITSDDDVTITHV